MPLDDKPVESVNEGDLISLQQSGTPEGKRIEYKERLNIETPEDKRKLLKHVASFANASGGHLIYGIREDKGVPVEICGLELGDADKTKLRVANVIRDGLEPKLTALGIQTIALANQKFALVLRISKGWNGPYIVKEEGRFYSRHSSGASMMDVSEIRGAFLQSAALGERIRALLEKRLALISDGQSPFGRQDKPHVVAHIIPFQAFNPGFQINWDAIAKYKVHLHPFFASGGNMRFNLDGHLTWFQDVQAKLCDGYTLVFRNGIVEVVDTRILEALAVPKHLDGPLLAGCLVKWVKGYLECSSQMGVVVPIAVSFCLIGVAGYALRTGTRPFAGSNIIDRNDLIMEEIVINDLSENVPAALNPIFDSIWNAGGFAQCCFQDNWL